MSDPREQGLDEGRAVRVEADGAQIDASAGPAVATVVGEGEQVERTWTAADFGHDDDWDHPDTRPRLRGWLHLFSFFGAIVAGAVLIPLGSVLGARAGFSVAVYCVTICGLFGVSALYHRRRWSPRGWKIMKRLDHSMIFLFIAGTYTPFTLLSVEQPFGAWLLARVWTAAPLGVGGLLYTVGGIAYAAKRPNPWPGTFGYHEVFHAMTIVAALCHYIAVYFAMYGSPYAG